MVVRLIILTLLKSMDMVLLLVLLLILKSQEEADKIVEIMTTCVPDLKIPFEVDTALCDNWGEVD